MRLAREGTREKHNLPDGITDRCCEHAIGSPMEGLQPLMPSFATGTRHQSNYGEIANRAFKLLKVRETQIGCPRFTG